jgi:hypothetical protein
LATRILHEDAVEFSQKAKFEELQNQGALNRPLEPLAALVVRELSNVAFVHKGDTYGPYAS